MRIQHTPPDWPRWYFSDTLILDSVVKIDLEGSNVNSNDQMKSAINELKD